MNEKFQKRLKLPKILKKNVRFRDGMERIVYFEIFVKLMKGGRGALRNGSYSYLLYDLF